MKIRGKRKVRLECHGGPLDGEWLSMEPGMTHVEVLLGRLPWTKPKATTIQGTLELARSYLDRVRKGRYSVQGFRPRGSKYGYIQVLRWEGEL